MNVKSAEKKENSTVELVIEVSAEDFDAAVEKAYRKNKGSISVPGFRKGKAPRKIIESMYGASVFYEEAVDAVYPTAYAQAVEEQGRKETFHGYIPSEQGYEFLREAIRKTIPLGRMASVDDIVRTALFLASDVSSYLTGQSLNLSGGMITEV